MQRITLQTSDLNVISWPKHCVSCGEILTDTDTTKQEIRIKKNLRSTLLPTPKKIDFIVCKKCSSKIAKASNISKFGYGLVACVFFLVVFVHPLQNERTLGGAALVFWIGLIIGCVGDMKKNNIIGTQIIRVTKDLWTFVLRDRTYAEIFKKENKNIQKQE